MWTLLPSQSNNDDFQWERSNQFHTGDLGDHTNGHGHYVYFDANNEISGDRGILHTGPLAPTDPADGSCLEFWYHIDSSEEVRK